MALSPQVLPFGVWRYDNYTMVLYYSQDKVPFSRYWLD
ncbi:MAG: hypothetical protein RHS_3569 [Robinsoniella sp. RHS]|nr:MAG: hypothetical protein RHS_3569 [Robinsoniella sp. RHS]